MVPKLGFSYYKENILLRNFAENGSGYDSDRAELGCATASSGIRLGGRILGRLANCLRDFGPGQRLRGYRRMDGQNKVKGNY